MKIQKIIKVIPAVLFLFVLSVSPLSAQGHFEFGFHYSRWSIDILRGMIEEGISDALGTNLKDKFLGDIQSDHPYLKETSYSQDVSFDSSGSNFGFEIRWYPGGHDSSFSIGFSVEKTSMTVSFPEVSASLNLKDDLTQEEASFQGDASGEFVIKPLSFHLSFRWDIIPSSAVHPYITFGFGAAGGTALDKAEMRYSYSGDLTVLGEDPEHYEDKEKKSLKELKEELEEEGEDFFLPGFVPFIQLNLGLKGKLTENLSILVDAGIFNGFLIRGGIAFRL